MENKISELLFESLVKTFEAEAAEARANLAIYFNNPVGIGEHPLVVQEMKELVDKMASAEDALESLKRNFGEDESELIKG